MKKLFAAFIAILMLPACGKDNSEMTETTRENSYKIQDIADGHYLLGEGETIIYPYENKIYAAGDVLGFYTPADHMRYTKLADISADALYVDGDGIYLLSEKKVTVLDHSGAEIAAFAAEYREDDNLRYTETVITADDHTLYYSYHCREEAENGGIDEFRMVLINRETGEEHRADLSCEKKPSFAVGIYPNNNGALLFCPYDDPAVLAGRNGIYQYDIAEDTLSFVSVFNYNLRGADMNPDGETIHLCYDNANTESFTFGSLTIENQTLDGDRIISMEKYEEEVAKVREDYSNYYLNRMFFTGYDYLMWDKKNHILSIYGVPSDNGSEILTVARPTTVRDENGDLANSYFCTYAEKDIVTFSAEYDCKVKSLVYPADTYGDRLRMKFLAGEDDFDIIYFDHLCASMLPAVLNYDMYLPLENYESITDGFNAYVDGVQEIMTHNGHIFGVPFTLAAYGVHVSEKYDELGLPAIADTWTQNDFWKICEAAIGKLNEDEALFRVLSENILLYPIIQYGADEMNFSYDDILTFAQNLKKYTDAGVLARSGGEDYVSNVIVPAQTAGMMWMVEESGRIVSSPLYNGKKYVNVSDFIFASAKTKNPDLAAEYLAFMLNRAGEYRRGQSLMLREKSAYYQFDDTRTRVPYEMDSMSIWITENSTEVLSGTEIACYDADGTFMKIAQQIINAMLGEELTPEEAAEELYSELCYRFLE